jgi:glutathionyl-hydroquinone reductase
MLLSAPNAMGSFGGCMGRLVNGKWVDQWYDTESTGGRFERQQQAFRNWVTPDGEPGPSGEGGFAAEFGRYHLYVSLACPWAHRTLIMRSFKGLQQHIGVSVVHWHMGERGWNFEPAPGVIPDSLFAVKYLYDLYLKADPEFTGRVTVPVLWDTRRDTIVNNESADIVRMLDSAFDGAGAEPGDYYPEALRAQIDAINERVYHTLNNGVYKCGFATSQEAYDEAVYPLFETLDWLETILSKQRYLTGNRLTEADIRTFTTLVRFDVVYNGHFKCNIRRLVDYPNLWGYTRELYQHPRIRTTVDFHHIRHHYYGSHPNVNPSGIVPAGPVLDFDSPHGRS